MKRNYYYMIWADAINRLKAVNGDNNSWKFYSMAFITLAMAFNLMVLMTILEKHILKIRFYNLDFNVFPGTKLNNALEFIVLFCLVPFAINYFLIFRNNRYESLIKQYKSYNGKLAATYIVASYFLPLILLVIAFLITKLIHIL